MLRSNIETSNVYISLRTLVPNSRDRQGKLWLPKNRKQLGKQPYNNMSFKYRPLISFYRAISTMSQFKQLK